MFIYILLSLFSIFKFQLTLISPPQLVNKLNNTSIKTSIGNFGEVPFGKNLLGYIIIKKQKDGTNYWCDYSQTEDLNIEQTENIKEYLPIILVDHSLGCKYAEKAFNVQKRGGRIMLLISDSNNLNNEYNVDDPIGNKVDIPTIIIGKDIGNIIKNFIYKNNDEKIIASIKFSGVKKTGEINIDFFYRSDDVRALNFFEEFSVFKFRFSNNFKFTPRLKYSKFVNDKTDDSLSVDSKYPCIKKEHYCVSSSNNLNIDNPREILFENLRQSCIYEIYGLEAFWSYVTFFSNKCANIDEPNFNERCSYEIIGENYKKNITKCMENLINSYSKVEEDYEYYNKKKIFSVPELTINGIKYKGSWSAKNIFNTICDSFLNDPNVCFSYSPIQIKNTNKLIWTIIICISLLIFFIFICFLLYNKKYINFYLENIINERVQMETQKIISQYKSFKDEKQSPNNTKIEMV